MCPQGRKDREGASICICSSPPLEPQWVLLFRTAHGTSALVPVSPHFLQDTSHPWRHKGSAFWSHERRRGNQAGPPQHLGSGELELAATCGEKPFLNFQEIRKPVVKLLVMEVSRGGSIYPTGASKHHYSGLPPPPTPTSTHHLWVC